MPCCCLKTLNLCNVDVCGTLEIEQLATAPDSGGENLYDLVLDYFETTVMLTQAQTEGENIVFDISMLNENFQYTGKVYDSNEQLVNIDVDEETYDCIKFKTVMNVSV